MATAVAQVKGVSVSTEMADDIFDMAGAGADFSATSICAAVRCDISVQQSRDCVLHFAGAFACFVRLRFHAIHVHCNRGSDGRSQEPELHS